MNENKIVKQKDNWLRQPAFLILGIIILLSMIGNLSLILKNSYLKQESLDKQVLLQQEKNNLELAYEETLVDLENYEGINFDLNETLNSMNDDIQAKKADIEDLLRTNSLTIKELNEAKLLIGSLQIIAHDYKAKVAELTASNIEFRQQNQVLQKDVVLKETVIGELESQNTSLAAENEQLFTQNNELFQASTTLAEEADYLEAKLNKAATLKIDKVEANGVRTKKNGKKVATNNTDKTEQLQVCFSVQPNTLTESTQQDMLLRIISPEGSPLAIQDMGSGVFTHAETNEDLQYTAKANIDLSEEKSYYCMFWEQNTPFAPGDYTTELYHNDYAVASTVLSLK